MGADLVSLIIDDDCDIHYFFRVLLKKKGVQTVHATSLQDAKARLRMINPSIIFIDNQLPDGLGIDFIPQLRIMAPQALIVAMTALYLSRSKQMALNSGADYFLEKPFSFDEVHDILERELQKGVKEIVQNG